MMVLSGNDDVDGDEGSRRSDGTVVTEVMEENDTQWCLGECGDGGVASNGFDVKHNDVE